MKCLPCNRLPPAGDTLHDQHAEVLARRGFRRWLLDQAMMLSDDFKKGRGPSSGRVLEVTAEGVIRLLPRVKVWMYVSTLPVCIPFGFSSRSAPYDVMLDDAMDVF